MPEKFISRRNLLKWLTVGGIAVLVGPACNDANSKPEGIVKATKLSPPVAPAVGREPEEVVKVAPHIWEKTDLAITKYAGSEKVRDKVTIFNIKPPFYNGTEPLRILMKTISTGISGIDMIVSNEFDNFVNLFVYENPVTIKGTQTYDKRGNLLAESSLEYPPAAVINTQDAHFYLHEVHYGKNGNIIFKARSELDKLGMKIKEAETEGKKEKEYYFFFPLH